MSVRKAVRAAEAALWMAGILAVGYCGLLWLQATRAQRAGEHWLWEASPATGHKLQGGDPVGRIEIPSAGVSAIVFEGIGDATLARGVGHVTSSALPGESGNIVLAAHRDTFFRRLERVQANDLVVLTTPAGRSHFRVRGISVLNPDQTHVMRRSTSPLLTLITCYPFRFIGAAPQRYVIQAVPRDDARETARTQTVSAP